MSITNFDSLPVPHDDGHWISERISRIVEIIRETWPNLDVKWVPPEIRPDGDAAFVIIEKLRDGREVPAFHVQTEEEFDERVLEKIYAADLSKHDVQGRLEAGNKAAKAVQQKKYQEFLEEQLEVAAAVLRSPKDTYIGPNGKVYKA